uniref:Uncharacterized protein n=1 Tax=Rhizophora mucronata TaxID=61149 RepID=A0A2P2Q2N4_RHIMU
MNDDIEERVFLLHRI